MKKQTNHTISYTTLDIDKRPMLIVDLNSGKYLKTKQGHEKLNLEPNPVDNRYYGYCPPKDCIDITRLGAKKSDDSISGVTIVYTQKKVGSSDREIIAFCENATVYRHGNDGKKLKRIITEDNGQKTYCSYTIESDSLVIVPESEPKFTINLANYNIHIFRGQRCFKGTYPQLDKKIFAFIRDYISHLNANDDLSFQEEIQKIDLVKGRILSDTSTLKPELLNGNDSLAIKKNSKIAKQALLHAEYKCAAHPQHTTFITTKGVPYMEGHHLIPCTHSNAQYFWNTKKRNIDCENNIVCLCPTCHRQIHYGAHNEKKSLIESLFNKQKAKLHSVGLDISLKALLSLYDI